MRFDFSTAAALALSGLATANPVSLDTRQASTLQAAMVAKGKSYYGTAVTLKNDNNEQNIIKSEMGSITPENSMKWDSIEPNRNQFNWGQADQYSNFAKQNGKQLRCHTLVWHSQLPGWVNNGGFNNATLIQVMTNHINQVVGRYKGACTHWDVVNEALNEDGTYRNSVWYRTIGEAFIPIAFRLTAAVDPNAKLYYNDYNLEYGTAKAQGALRILKLVQSYGVKIDGIGLQGHLTVTKTPTNDIPTPSLETLTKTLRLYTDLNVDVAYTELDIRMNTPANSNLLSQQADHYKRVTASCMAVPRCVGITVWGISDKNSWVPGTFPGEGAALLWNENYQKKPAYTSSLQAIQEANSTKSS